MLPPKTLQFIEEWRRMHPDWEFKLWNEHNSPVDLPYISNALSNQNWANASNYLRLHAMIEEGGIYLDPYVKLISPLDKLLSHECFLGFESGEHGNGLFGVNNAVLGAQPNHPFVVLCKDQLLKTFDGTEPADHSSLLLTTSILKDHFQLKKYGSQLLSNNITLFEKEVFYINPRANNYNHARTIGFHTGRHTSNDYQITGKTFFANGANTTVIVPEIQNTSRLIELMMSAEYYTPDFKGEWLLSIEKLSPPDKEKLISYLETSSLPYRIQERGIDKGNSSLYQAIQNTTKDWVMVLGDEMAMINNPFPSIAECIDLIQTDFINLSLVNSDFRTIDHVEAGVGPSGLPPRPVEYVDILAKAPSISDYLNEKAFVADRKALLGIFNSNEYANTDTESFPLSHALYEKGARIGNAATFSFVDLNSSQGHVPETPKKLKKVAMIVDVRNWAFHKNALNIQEHLKDRFEFTILFHDEYIGPRRLEFFHELMKGGYDILYFFWRESLHLLFSEKLMEILGSKYNVTRKDFEQFLNNTVILTGVYDHLSLSLYEKWNNIPLFTNNSDGYIVSSRALSSIYHAVPSYHPPYMTIPDGVDTRKFFRKPQTNWSTPGKKLKVGWAGNSQWGTYIDGLDHKGFNTIIKPVVEELKEEGYPIELLYADKQIPSTLVHPDQMNDFYNKLDVYICASDLEGVGHPVMESMACGLTVITTDVGIAREVFGKLQKQFILKERSKNALKEKLILLLHDRSLLKIIGNENQIRISNWTWKQKAESYGRLFDYYYCKKLTGYSKHKEFPAGEPEIPVIVKTIEGKQVKHHASLSQEEYTNLYVNFESFELLRQKAIHYQRKTKKIQEWYDYEYELLPKWFKKIATVVKVLQGRRSLKSFFKRG
ncbi:MAG: glycosyltransferase [Chitinophagaceae bacterium]|nr:glycosyltransferase [Chitinophagaceae bacterium]